jgi:hypothetical protein
MSRRKNFIILIIGAVVLIYCNKDKLNQPALGNVDASSLENKEGVEALLIGAYSLLDGISPPNAIAWSGAASNWIFGSICGSEGYKGSDIYDQGTILSIEKFSVTSNTPEIEGKWVAVYTGVQRANTVLQVLIKTKDISEEDRQRIIAEARFLRAHFHFEAIKIWNKVPYVDETITYDEGNYLLSNDTLIWPAIENDFKFAMNILPATMLSPGRANKYAAEAFLAKAYMFQKKYDLARPLLQDLIANGVTAHGDHYALANNYQDNFNAAKKNGPESVFAVQNSVNDGSSGTNGSFGDVLNFPNASDAPGNGCCGFFPPSQYLVNHFKTDASGLPDFVHFNDVDVTNDEGIESDDSSYKPYSDFLDPRLDWTVGRRGIPYLDWGNHPGKRWIKDQHFAGPYSTMKNIYYKSQQGAYTDASFWTTGATAINTNLVRFADVLLWAAEVEAKFGNLEKATNYVNQVRRRMEDSSGWVHTYIDPSKPEAGFTKIPAANYRIGEYPTFTTIDSALMAIRYERMLELGMEGHRFFDLVRWDIADQEINTYFQTEMKKREYLVGAFFTKNKNEYFPLPQSQIDLSAGANGVPLLKQNPGY